MSGAWERQQEVNKTASLPASPPYFSLQVHPPPCRARGWQGGSGPRGPAPGGNGPVGVRVWQLQQLPRLASRAAGKPGHPAPRRWTPGRAVSTHTLGSVRTKVWETGRWEAGSHGAHPLGSREADHGPLYRFPILEVPALRWGTRDTWGLEGSGWLGHLTAPRSRGQSRSGTSPICMPGVCQVSTAFRSRAGRPWEWRGSPGASLPWDLSSCAICNFALFF